MFTASQFENTTRHGANNVQHNGIGFGVMSLYVGSGPETWQTLRNEI